MKVHRCNTTRLWCPDDLMIKVWNCLVNDFRQPFDRSDYFEAEKCAMARGVVHYRSQFSYDRGYHTDVPYFKRRYQLESFFKRYRFQEDLYTDQELNDRTVEKFLAVQRELKHPSQLSEITFRVVQTARRFAKELLGNYDLEEHLKLCRFGKRASVGNPLRDSYLDIKAQCLSGSPEHQDWFLNKVLLSDDLLYDACKNSLSTVEELYFPLTTDALTYVSVPKSFKIKRGMMPNTVLGHFYSYGLGRILRDRLKKGRIKVNGRVYKLEPLTRLQKASCLGQSIFKNT